VRRGELLARAGLVAASILFSLIVLELGCRIWSGGVDLLVHWPNRVADRVRKERDWPACSHIHDAQLGWRPNPGFVSPAYNVDARGFRRVPAIAAADDRPSILAVGDSFTAGDEVLDDETWPAYLQGLLGRRVHNGGVSAYGLDQMVLRAEQEAAIERPAAIVLSFIADDLLRNELRGLWTFTKPYFELRDGQLVLHPRPPGDTGCDTLPFWRRALGWSVLVEVIVFRARWSARWFYYDNPQLPPGAGVALGCPLVERLAGLKVPVLVVLQYERTDWKADPRSSEEYVQSRRVLDCAAASGLAVLDLGDTIERAVQARGVDALYREDHHSPEGNRIVAGAIAAKLKEMGF
jgi:hypothetical protein